VDTLAVVGTTAVAEPVRSLDLAPDCCSQVVRLAVGKAASVQRMQATLLKDAITLLHLSDRTPKLVEVGTRQSSAHD